MKDEEKDATEEKDESGGEEIRAPLQAFIRVILVVVVALVLIGFIIALFLRPDEVVESAESLLQPASGQLVL